MGIICGTVQPANFFPTVSRFTRAFLTLRVSNHLGLKQTVENVNCGNLPSDIQKLVSCRLTFANIFHKINHSPLQNLRIPSPKKKNQRIMRKEQYQVSYDPMFNISYITSQKNNMLGFMLISPAQRLATDHFATTILSFSFNIRAT